MTNLEQEDIGYFEATREYLLSTLKDPSIVKATIDLVAPVAVERVLDLGSGIGQALFPLAVKRKRLARQ